jgi:hypothetical protein
MAKEFPSFELDDLVDAVPSGRRGYIEAAWHLGQYGTESDDGLTKGQVGALRLAIYALADRVDFLDPPMPTNIARSIIEMSEAMWSAEKGLVGGSAEAQVERGEAVLRRSRQARDSARLAVLAALDHSYTERTETRLA